MRENTEFLREPDPPPDWDALWGLEGDAADLAYDSMREEELLERENT